MLPSELGINPDLYHLILAGDAGRRLDPLQEIPVPILDRFATLALLTGLAFTPIAQAFDSVEAAEADTTQRWAVSELKPAVPMAWPSSYRLLAQAAATDAGASQSAPLSIAPTPRAAQCAASYSLPWGPIRNCSDAIAAGVGTIAMVAGFLGWWSDGFNSKFTFRNEGWFGPDTYSAGVDKLGHAFSLYVTTRLLNQAFRWAGEPQEVSVARAGLLSFAIGLGIEVFDGLEKSGKYGFSWQDLVMDSAGILLAMYAEETPGFDKWFAFRWRRETSSLVGGGTYDSHQYFGVLRLSGWSELGVYNPLRYMELMVGYGAFGYRGDSGTSNYDNRQRSIYAGVGLNLTELLDRTAFSGSLQGGRTQWFATEFLKYVQLPGTASIHAAKTWRP